MLLVTVVIEANTLPIIAGIKWPLNVTWIVDMKAFPVRWVKPNAIRNAVLKLTREETKISRAASVGDVSCFSV